MTSSKIRVVVFCIFSVVLILPAMTAPLAGQCVDTTKDPAGCQPSTLDTPIGQMPSVRVNRQGHIDPMSSEADARAGAAGVEERVHLFRNFDHLHWVITVPSVKDSATGAWKGGDLDGAGEAAAWAFCRQLSFSCARQRRRRQARDQYFQDPTGSMRQPPVQVGEIPALFSGNQGFDERELRSLVFKTSERRRPSIMIRNAGTATEGRCKRTESTSTRASPSRIAKSTVPRTVARILSSGTIRESESSLSVWPFGLRDCRIRKSWTESPRHGRAGRDRRETERFYPNRRCWLVSVCRTSAAASR
jgi:hypothetical protein